MRSAFALALLLAGGVGSLGFSEPDKPGPLPDGGVLLSSGWHLKPVGDQVAVDTLPMRSVASKDGKYLLILHGGIEPPSIGVIDLASKRVIASTPLPDAWLGLAMAPTGDLVYAGGGTSGKVYELSLAPDGKLTRTREFSTPDSKLPGTPFMGDVALSPDGRVLYAADLYGDNIAQVNLQSGKMVDHWKTGHRPYRIAVSPDGAHLLVSSWAEGAVYEHESGTGILVTKLRVGPHPTDLLWLNKPVPAENGGTAYAGRVFVTTGNTNSVLTLGVTADGQMTSGEPIQLSMTPMSPLGMTPSALATDARGMRLYVACSDANVIAVADISGARARLAGFIPTGWYPTAVNVLKTDQLAVLNGNGTGEKGGRAAASALLPAPRGSVQLVPLQTIPSAGLEHLDEWSRLALANTPYRDELIYGPVTDEQEGFFSKLREHPSPFQHVIYVIKGDGTYDSVLGDLGKGNGDKSLARLPRAATPNLHALAEQFITYDNFYSNAATAIDGQNWVTAAIAPDYTARLWPSVWAGRSKLRDFEGGNLANTPPAGYLWNNALQAGLTVRNYGEWVTDLTSASGRNVSQSQIVNDPPLASHTDRNYRGPKDVDRAAEFVREWKAFDQKNEAPQLSLVRLSNDQNAGEQNASDNDAAIGLLVDAVSHSKLWSTTAIFIVNVAAQSGVDHVNAYRAPAWVVSPYTQRGTVDSGFYNQAGALRTMELILGLRPMTHFDAGAKPMFGGFARQADTRAFTKRN